jgi:hypothetical protein
LQPRAGFLVASFGSGKGEQGRGRSAMAARVSSLPESLESKPFFMVMLLPTTHFMMFFQELKEKQDGDLIGSKLSIMSASLLFFLREYTQAGVSVI